MSYVTFQDAGKSESGKTQIVNVTGRGNLGQIKWYAPWRRYVFYPDHDTLFDVNCLKEISDHITTMMSER